MTTSNYIQLYLESIGLPSDWQSTIDSEDYYLGQILLSLASASLNSYNIPKQKDLRFASQWLKQLTARFYTSSSLLDKKEIDVKEESFDHPAYYNKGKIETIQFLAEIGVVEDFCLGNAIKYLSRYRYKGKPVEDLRKAEWYINYLIK